MYQVPIQYQDYYKDFINRNIREFKLECVIKGGTGSATIPESEISSFSIEYDLLSGSEEYTIGNLAQGKLTMTVSKNVLVFETNTIILTLKLKAQDVHGSEIWIPIPIGHFYVFNISSTNLSKTINAYDDLYKAELEQQFESKLQYPTTTREVVRELCTILNIGCDETSIPDIEIVRPSVVTELIVDVDDKVIVKETDSNQVCLGLKVGKALSCVASYLGGNFIIDGDMKLKFISFPKSIVKSYDFTKFAMPTMGSSTYSVKRMTCTGYTDQIIDVKIDDSIETAIELNNPFIDKVALMQLLDELSNISYQQTNVRVKGDPTLQLGDLIELYEVNSNGIVINKITVPILRMTFNFTGGCTNTIESPCKTKTEKTINYKGTISSRLDNLENTVSSTSSEIEKINNSLATFSSVKDSIDTMDIFIDSLSTELASNKIKQYNLILNQIEQNGEKFEKQYSLIYSSKYL